MAKATWSAFECTSLASKFNDTKEQERLFRFGYDQGKNFIAALQKGKVEQKDLDSEAPFIMLLLLQGPTPDFMLGRIFESAQDSVLEDVYKTGDHFNNDEEQFYAARHKFNNANCQLIGK